MTTKEQERKALEQIKKIVDGLGQDSYIATAFEGAFEDAEYNIINDAAYSMKARWDSARKTADELSAKYEHLIGVKNHLEKKLAEAEETAQKEYKNAHDYAMKNKEKGEQIIELQAKVDTMKGEIDALISDKDAALKEKDFEIIQLKAKLYDLMNK